MSMFKRGYEEVSREAKRQEENRANIGKKLWRFFISKDGDEALVRFLTDSPVNFYEHNIKGYKNGKEVYESHVCTGDNCKYCAQGDKSTFKSAFLVIDKRVYTDSQGKEKPSGIRLYVQGATVTSQLKRLLERYGLTNRDYLIVRSGKGNKTSYMFDRTDDTTKVTKDEITNLLPEALRPLYNGTSDSLYTIIENQLEMLAEAEDEELDTRSNEEVVNTATKNLVSVDDEEVPAKKSAPLSTKRGLFGRGKADNSAKALFNIKTKNKN